MLKIQLLSDTEYHHSFSTALKKVEAIELVEDGADVLLDLSFLDVGEKLARLSQLTKSNALLITNTLTLTASAVQQTVGDKFAVVGVPIFPGYFERQKLIEFMLPFGSTSDVTKVRELFTALGKESEQIQDSVAGVFPRTLSMIINEAAFAVQEGVASPADIDTAMKLGTNYPTGPLKWCDEIGANAVVATLDALAREYGQDRYKVASRLRRMAESGATFY